MSYSPADAAGRELAWLLTLTVRGVAVRAADVEVVVSEGRTGTDWLYPALVDEVSPPSLQISDAGALPSVSGSVRLLWPTEGGLAEVLAGDPDLSDATAELALWVPGTEYTRRHVVVLGAATLSYGEPHEGVDVGISLRASEDRGLVPELAVTTTRWPRSAGSMVCPEGSVGRVYPLVFGAPGYPGTLEVHTGWEVVLVEVDSTDRDNSSTSAVVLLHGGPAEMVGASIKLYNRTTGGSADVTPTRTVDAAGADVVIATVAAATLPIAEGDVLFASATSTTPIGLPAPGRSGGLRGVGDLARWLLERSTLLVDWGASEGDLERLNSYRVDGRLAEQRTPTEVLADVLERLPCGWYVAPGGLAIRHWPDDNAPEALTVGPDWGCERTGPVDLSAPDDVRDAWRADYDLDAESGDYARSISLVPDPDPSDATQVASPYGRQAFARSPTPARLRWEDPVELPHIADGGTVVTLLTAMARRACQLRATVSYACPVEYQFVGLGSVVRWTDSEIRRDERARVVAIEHGTAGCVLQLETIPRGAG